MPTNNYFIDGEEIKILPDTEFKFLLSKYNIVMPNILNIYEHKILIEVSPNNAILINNSYPDTILKNYNNILKNILIVDNKYYMYEKQIKDNVKLIRCFGNNNIYYIKDIEKREFDILSLIKNLNLKFTIKIISLEENFVITEEGEKIDWNEDFLKKDKKTQYKYIVNMFDAIRELNYNMIYHCDIKRDNFVKVGDIFKIIDFGYSTTDLGKSSVRGSAGYMSPDALYGQTKVYRDFWSFAALLVFIYTGKSYFEQIELVKEGKLYEQVKDYYNRGAKVFNFSLGYKSDDNVKHAVDKVLNIWDDNNPEIFKELHQMTVKMKEYIFFDYN